MKNKNKLSLIFIIVFLAAGFSNAQFISSTSKVGTTAGQFLKIAPGARAIGMGGAYTGISNDIFAAYWNPAGISNITNGGQVAFNHAEWLADITYDWAAASLYLGDVGSIYLSLTTLATPEEKVRTIEYPEGDGRVWDATSFSIGFGYARKLTDKFSIGFYFKYVSEQIWNSTASGVALDIGTYYVTPFNDMVIGASISNFGSKMQMDGRDVQFDYDPNNDLNSGPNNVRSQYLMGEYDLPLNFKLGVAMDVVKNRFLRVTAAVDAVHPNDNTEYVNSGLEVAYDEMFMVRAGYKQLFMRDNEAGLSYGGGIRYKFDNGLGFMLNYGWADYGRLESVQFVDVAITF